MMEAKMANNDKVTELSGKHFDDFTSKGLVLIDFFADWCMPCLMMAPIMDELSEKFKGKIKFGKINVDDNQDLARKFRVLSIPNFVLFKDGQPVDHFIGAMPEEDFEERLQKHL